MDHRANDPVAARSTVTLRAVLAVGAFRKLVLADAQSLIGDQLARLALTVLVFSHTESAAWAALTYAVTLLPALARPLLGGVADRWPRRGVMVWCALAQAAVVGSMALPGLPVVALVVLLIVLQIVAAPFVAAQQAVLPDVLGDTLYQAGVGLRQAMRNVAQVVGFVGGGAVIVSAGTRWALAIDAMTFVVSAIVVHRALRSLPTVDAQAGAPNTTPAAAGVAHPAGRASVVEGVRRIWRDRRRRLLVALVWLAAFTIVPEALAVPYVAEIGGSAQGAGILLAADPVGMAVGSIVLTRWIPAAWRERLMGPLAVASMVPLLAFAAQPPVPIAALLLMLTGVFAGYQAVAMGAFAQEVPTTWRGLAIGIASGGLVAVQGLGAAVGGALVTVVGSNGGVVALAGGAGAVAAGAAAAAWRTSPSPGSSPRPSSSAAD